MATRAFLLFPHSGPREVSGPTDPGMDKKSTYREQNIMGA